MSMITDGLILNDSSISRHFIKIFHGEMSLFVLSFSLPCYEEAMIQEYEKRLDEKESVVFKKRENYISKNSMNYFGESKTIKDKNFEFEEEKESMIAMVKTVGDKFMEEELEFLREEGIELHDSDTKWSWLSNELAEKYFVSVILPYYIIKSKLIYDELDLLGFRAFRNKLKRMKGIHFSEMKN